MWFTRQQKRNVVVGGESDPSAILQYRVASYLYVNNLSDMNISRRYRVMAERISYTPADMRTSSASG